MEGREHQIGEISIFVIYVNVITITVMIIIIIIIIIFDPTSEAVTFWFQGDTTAHKHNGN